MNLDPSELLVFFLDATPSEGMLFGVVLFLIIYEYPLNPLDMSSDGSVD